MKGYNYNNADSLPDYFDDIIDSSENPPYSYKVDLKIHFAAENGFKVFYILAEALYFMQNVNKEKDPRNREEGILLATKYIQKLLIDRKVKVRIFSIYYDKGDMKYAKYYTKPSDAEVLAEDIKAEWNNLKLRRLEKERLNKQNNVLFPYGDPSDNPDEEEFWFYYYDGIPGGSILGGNAVRLTPHEIKFLTPTLLLP